MDQSRSHQSRSSISDNRFHYPANRPQQQQKPPGSQYAQPSQYSQFPPHPSVRPPPNVKLAPRQVPAGVGVAAPPVRYANSPRPHPQRTINTGQMVQDYKFPAAPPIPQSGSSRSRQEVFQQSPGKKNNNNHNHESYMSSVLDDFATPGTTPGSRSKGFTASRVRYSGSVYAESEALGVEERYDGTGSRGSSRTSSPSTSPQIVRQASLGKRAKPAMTIIRRASHLEKDIPEEPSMQPPTSKTAAMAALSAAIAAGMNGQRRQAQPYTGTPGSRSHTPVRMPFDDSPPVSPSADKEFMQTPKTTATFASGNLLDRAPGTSHSAKSSNPLLGLGIEQPSMSTRIPPGRRPPKLDMDAVREAEARGSTTSLADLIKRATRLAANLDRGKTASRLGMLDMFGSQEKLNRVNRDSTMSDMISAFPAPATGGTPRSEWPPGEKGDMYASTTDLSKTQLSSRKRRKCCGLSLPVFFLILIIVIILVAAAVLIPIFLILVPQQHDNDAKATDCATVNPCKNGGTNVPLPNEACSCVCSNGFTGTQCETPGTAEDCVTRTLKDGVKEYKNATLGVSVIPYLSDRPNQFAIPINITNILALFSIGDLSCSSENSLVDFNTSSTDQTVNSKRFVMIPSLEPPSINEQHLVMHGESALATVTHRAVSSADPHLERRQDGVTVGTSNGIVFQAPSSTLTNIGVVPTAAASSASIASETVSAAITPTDSATPSSLSPSSSSSASTSVSSKSSSRISSKELDFARVVVLYVLQESRTMTSAVRAQQEMESFFANKTLEVNPSNSTTVDVPLGSGSKLTADFGDFSVSFGNGTKVGG